MDSLKRLVAWWHEVQVSQHRPITDSERTAAVSALLSAIVAAVLCVFQTNALFKTESVAAQTAALQGFFVLSTLIIASRFVFKKAEALKRFELWLVRYCFALVVIVLFFSTLMTFTKENAIWNEVIVASFVAFLIGLIYVLSFLSVLVFFWWLFDWGRGLLRWITQIIGWKKYGGEVMTSSDETFGPDVDLPKFKQLMFRLHNGFPNALFSEDQIKSVIIMENVRKDLLDKGFITREKSSDGFLYRLGPNGLSLVNGWIMERSSNETERLTKSDLFTDWSPRRPGVIPRNKGWVASGYCTLDNSRSCHDRFCYRLEYFELGSVRKAKAC